MSNIYVKIQNVRNIKQAEIVLPYDKGLYALVGENGSGKSTLMLAVSLIVKTSSSKFITPEDTNKDSEIILRIDEKEDTWKRNQKGRMTTGNYSTKLGQHRMIAKAHCHGFYEGSIFYGCRFNDYTIVDSFFEKPNYEQYLKPADAFVVETLGYIVHNDKDFYRGLLKIKNRTEAEGLGFLGIPYFQRINGHIISQYRMSSGESMLISLIDFINNLVIKGSYDKLLFLIDEVELALHPGAIDRLVLFLNDLVQKSKTELVVFFSTHSAELLERIQPANIFLLENNAGKLECINPCYPNYAVRNLYVPNGFDFLILVEDELAKALVEKVLRDNMMAESKLCCVLPAGGWSQMLKLHSDMITYNTLGVGKRIISIYDGDVKGKVKEKKQYNALPKGFLPVPCIEKFLRNKLLVESDRVFIKRIGDKYFNQRSLDNIISDYKNDERTKNSKDSDGKNFYHVLLANLERIGINEHDFIKYICDDICEVEKESVGRFKTSLEKLLL